MKSIIRSVASILRERNQEIDEVLLPIEKVVKESAIVSKLKRLCDKHGVDIQRLKGQNGWFDYVIFWKGGKPSLVETKKPKGGRYEPLQLRTHAKYRRLGYDVAVLHTKEAVDELFERHACKLSSHQQTSTSAQKSLTTGGSTNKGQTHGKSSGKSAKKFRNISMFFGMNRP